MAIEKVVKYKCTPAELWDIVGTPDRVDWVPGMTECEFDGEVRTVDLPGAGTIKERILSRDEATMTMSYSCIESPTPLEKHLARMAIEADGDGCKFTWTTEILPVAFEPFIEKSIDGAIAQIRTMVES